MNNREIAHVLFSIADLLALGEANPFRIRAYRRAAFAVRRLPHEVRDLVKRNQEIPIEGLGQSLHEKIVRLATGERMNFYEALIAEHHPAMRSLMRVHGVGPKIAARLFAELHLTSPESLLFAARRGRLRALPGFGAQLERALGQAAARIVAREEPQTPPTPPAPGGGQLPLPIAIPAASAQVA
ncbi:MAG: helix-hairpin-helix domain-containing protein [Chloroflexia bacterium]